MPNSHRYFGVFSPKTNYLNFIISVSVPDNLDALRLVRTIVYSKWCVREISFQQMLDFDAKKFYNAFIGCHLFAIGSRDYIRFSVFLTKFARRYVNLVSYSL